MNTSQHCATCVKPLYEIITYCNAREKEFNVIINTKCMPIQGFILTFVDECANPIIFDNYNSFMKIESITPYPICQYPSTYDYYREICPFSDKTYYSYTQQVYNCMPLNPALWAYYVNINTPLKLSFKLDYAYTKNVFLYINMFFPQGHPACNLEQVIRNCIISDQKLSCVRNPFACGYISWMTDLQEQSVCPPPPPADTNCECDDVIDEV
jgi:hypothetical protein